MANTPTFAVEGAEQQPLKTFTEYAQAQPTALLRSGYADG